MLLTEANPDPEETQYASRTFAEENSRHELMPKWAGYLYYDYGLV